MLVPLRGWMLLCFLIGLIALSYYRMFGELPVPSSEDERARVQLAQRWAQRVASEVRRLPDRPLVAVARVVNDSDGILTGQLKSWIARRNVRMVNDQWYADLHYKSGIAEEPETIEAAIEPLVGNGIEYIVAAEIENWTTFPEYEAVLRGHVEIRNGRTGESVLHFQLALSDIFEVAAKDSVPSDLKTAASDAVTNAIPVEMAPQQQNATPTAADVSSIEPLRSIASVSSLPGIMLWFASVISLPLLGRTRLQRLLSKRRNRVNLGLLACWVLVTGVLAVILWIRLLPTLQGLLTGIPAVLLAAVYFGFCCYCLERAS